MMRTLVSLPALTFALFALAACDSGGEPGGDQSAVERDPECTPKDEQSCSCGSAKGTSVCSSDGEWGACKCDAKDAGAAKDGSTRTADGGKRADAGGKPSPVDNGADGGASSDESKGGAAPPVSTSETPLPCDVAALLAKHCAECHGEKKAFGAPMSLVSWDDLVANAPLSKGEKSYAVALERMKDDAKPMPPAPHARVSDAEIALFEKWVEDGAEKGAESCGDQPGEMAADGLLPLPEDCEEEFELRAHNEPKPDDKSKFKISATPALEGNQYHCFYFDPPYGSDASMFGFQPIIDNKELIHHWILYATDNKTHASGTSAACNAAEPGAYFVSGWAPGADNTTFGKDVSLQLPTGPRAGLILEVHYYNATGKTQEDSSGIRFCTGKKSKRAHLAGVHTLGSEGICIPPAQKQEVAGTCVPREGSEDIHITGMWPHMHKHARRMKVTLKRKAGGTEVIHDAPFDFNAQVFHQKNDIIVKPGDTLETRCYFENTTNERVKFGERTQDEMCYAFVVAWPAGSLISSASASVTPDLLNRCSDPLSILQSCNGLADRPVTVEHP
jgi:hypothetical protein